MRIFCEIEPVTMCGEQQLVHPCSSHILWGSNHLRYIEAGGLAWSWAREPQGHQGLITHLLASNYYLSTSSSLPRALLLAGLTSCPGIPQGMIFHLGSMLALQCFAAPGAL